MKKVYIRNLLPEIPKEGYAAMSMRIVDELYSIARMHQDIYLQLFHYEDGTIIEITDKQAVGLRKVLEPVEGEEFDFIFTARV